VNIAGILTARRVKPRQFTGNYICFLPDVKALVQHDEKDLNFAFERSQHEEKGVSPSYFWMHI
jgi:hypothetical protein